MSPVTWVILGDKGGDNGQVNTIVDALGWPVERKHVHMQPRWVLGKPRYRPSLDHLDLEQSDPLEPPWPDLVITSGRRPSMAALWVRRRSGGKTRVVLVGKPSGRLMDFSLVVVSAENQVPPMPNVQAITLPFMRADPDAVERETRAWSERFATMPRPLIAVLVGGETNPFVMNRAVARQLLDAARRVIDELGGTPYITTSRRTTPEVVSVLREELPAGAHLFEWSADAGDNPYHALLGTADGFVVTGDSVSMMVEVIKQRRPLAVFPLPGGPLDMLDRRRRSLAHWLFNPRLEGRGDRWRHRVARGVFYIDRFKLLSGTRDFRAFHRLLVERGLAVWEGEAFRNSDAQVPDDLPLVVRRIRALFTE